MEFKFNNLRESNEFLNILIDNVNIGIFIVDQNIRLYQVNDSCEVLFNKEAKDLIGYLCGNAIGCGNVIGKDLECGESTHCKECLLRKSILDSFLKKIPVQNQMFEREFISFGVSANSIVPWRTLCSLQW